MSRSSLFLFGAPSHAPHSQFVLAINRDEILRFLPWRCDSHSALEKYLNENTTQALVLVPGYRIILLCQALSPPGDLRRRFVNRPHGALGIAESSDQAADAAQFYLTHKIIPNATKYNRYRIR